MARRLSIPEREKEACPLKQQHNLPDFGYAGPDAKWMAENRQVRCEGCGYYVVVIPRSYEQIFLQSECGHLQPPPTTDEITHCPEIIARYCGECASELYYSMGYWKKL